MTARTITVPQAITCHCSGVVGLSGYRIWLPAERVVIELARGATADLSSGAACQAILPVIVPLGVQAANSYPTGMG